tara:strand:- start:885 stop:1589 length:705 start_codon:yes stop_codon:yes gene_type:complete
MQIQDMRSYIHSVVEIDADDISNDVLNRFLGEAYDLVVYSEKRWPWYEVSTTFTTASGTSDYTLATIGASVTNGLREIGALRTDSQVLEYIGRDEGDATYPLNSSGNGEPFRWSYWEEKVRMYPTPSSAETIYVRGWKSPTAFGAGSVDGTSPSDFPEPFHILFATYGIARAYEQQEDLEMANSYHMMFTRELDNLRSRYLDAPAPQPVVLNGTSARRWMSSVNLPGRLRYSWE